MLFSDASIGWWYRETDHRASVVIISLVVFQATLWPPSCGDTSGRHTGRRSRSAATAAPPTRRGRVCWGTRLSTGPRAALRRRKRRRQLLCPLMEERQTIAGKGGPAEAPPTPDRSEGDPRRRRHSFQWWERRRRQSQWEEGGEEEEEGGVRKRRRGRQHRGKETRRLRRKRRKGRLLAKTSVTPLSTSTLITCRCRAPPPCSSPQKARWSRWRWWYRRESSSASWSPTSTRWGSCWSCRERRVASARWRRRWRSALFSWQPHWRRSCQWTAPLATSRGGGSDLGSLQTAASSPSHWRIWLAHFAPHTQCLSSHLPSSYEASTGYTVQST